MSIQSKETQPNAEDLPDAELMFRYRTSGDASAAEILILRHSKMVKQYLRGMLSEEADVEDTVQDLWMKILKKPEAYKDDNFKGWILRIAHNLAIDRYRRQRPDISLDSPTNRLDGGECLADIIPDDAFDPARHAVSEDTLAFITDQIRKLPDLQRQVFLMRVSAGMSFREIADELKIPLNTALGRMHYAVTQLRDVLADCPDETGTIPFDKPEKRRKCDAQV